MMSFRAVRDSKFRHVFGQAIKHDQCYDNIRITKNSWDSNFCDVNPKYLAIVVEISVGGAFLVLPLSKTGKVDANHPLVSGHNGPVLDVAWCPFNDNVIASASEDAVVRLWHIPEGGLTQSVTQPLVELYGHQRKVGFLQWHPSANNVLLSASNDLKIIIWNVQTCDILSQIQQPDFIFHCSWNNDGSRLLTTCKDRKFRIYDPKTGELLREAEGHKGTKMQRAIYLRNGCIFTTGFSSLNERQYTFRSESSLGQPIVCETLDNGSGPLFPFYDQDLNLIYLSAKGDSNIRYFELSDEVPFVHYIDTYQSVEPQRGMGFMPKRGCDIVNCEIARFFKLNSQGVVEVLSFTVPRKSELFQEDIYPDTASDVPALTAEQWINGENREPILISIKDLCSLKSRKTYLKQFLQTHSYKNFLSDYKNSVQYSNSVSKTNKYCQHEESHSNNLECFGTSSSDTRERSNTNSSTKSVELDQLWRRDLAGKLQIARVNEYGKLLSDFEPEPDKSNSANSLAKAVRRLTSSASDDKEKEKEDLAWKVAEMIINDVRSVTEGHRYNSDKS